MSISARGNREHFERDYTSKRKIKAFSHDEASARAVDTTSCAFAPMLDARCTSRATMQACAQSKFRRQRKNTDRIWVFEVCGVIATASAKACAPRANNRRQGRKDGAKHAVKLVKKILDKRAGKALAQARIRCESSESGKSDSRMRRLMRSDSSRACASRGNFLFRAWSNRMRKRNGALPWRKTAT